MNGVTLAGTYVYIGVAGNVRVARPWNTASFWQDGNIPVPGDEAHTIIIACDPANGYNNSTNNIPGIKIKQLIFTTAGNNVSGSLEFVKDPAIEDQIVNLIGTNGVSNATTTGLADLSVKVEAGQLNWDTTSQFNIKKRGVGGMGFHSSLLSKRLTIEQGTVTLASSLTSLKDVVVGTGTSAPGAAVLKLSSDDVIDDLGSITVASDGVLEMGVYAEKFARLEVQGSSVKNLQNDLQVSESLVLAGAKVQGTGTLFVPANGSISARNGAPSVINTRLSVPLGVPLNVVSGSETSGPDAPDLVVTGVIHSEGQFAKSGNGTLVLQGSRPNTHEGTTFVEDGTLALDSPYSVIPGDIVVGTGLREQGAVRLVQVRPSQLTLDANVTVNADGHALLIGNEEVKSLSVTDGTVEIGGGTLSLSGSNCLSMKGGHIKGAGALELGGSSTFSSFSSHLPGVEVSNARIDSRVIVEYPRVFRVEPGEHQPELVISGEIDDFGAGGDVIKTGLGTMELAGTSELLGATRVNQGSLLITGQQTRSEVRILDGARLLGTGSAGVISAREGAVVAPGLLSSTGVLNAVRADLSGGTLDVIYGNSSTPKISRLNVTGSLNITGTVLEAGIAGTLVPGVPHVVASYGTLAGRFSKIPQGVVVNYAYNNGVNSRNISIMKPAVPEIGIGSGGKEIASGGASKFGTVTVGGKVTKTYKITNSGTGPLQNIAVSLSGTKKGFSVTKPSAATLAPGKSMTFKVTFSPTVAGKQPVDLRVKSNDADESTYIIKLSGNGKVAKPKTKKAADTLAKIGNGKGGKSSAKVAGSKNAAAAASAAKQGSVNVDGQKFLTLTVSKPAAGVAPESLVEVSPNLLDWSSGPKHVTVVSDDGKTVTLRDDKPSTAAGKRYIRLVD